MFNPTLLQLANWRVKDQLEKSAFQPPGGGDPSQSMPGAMGGAGGGDPSMGGGAPSMDPSMGGGAPPPDPSAGGGMPSPDITETIRSVIQQELARSGGGGAGMGGKPGGAIAKPDLNVVANDIFQVKKILTYLLNIWQIPLPPDVLDGPNRDPSTGAPVAPGTPGSTSDPSQQAAQPQQGAIKPPQPIQPAFGPDPSGATKSSEAKASEVKANNAISNEANESFKLGEASAEMSKFADVKNKAAALAQLAQSLRNKK